MAKLHGAQHAAELVRVLTLKLVPNMLACRSRAALAPDERQFVDNKLKEGVSLVQAFTSLESHQRGEWVVSGLRGVHCAPHELWH